MAITLETVARNGACNGTVDLIDVGSGTALLRIRQGSTTLCNISLPNPAFGSASTGTATAAGLPLSGTGIAAGTPDGFQVLNRDGTVIFSGTAGTSGTDCILASATIALGGTVTVTGWTHTQPA